MSSNLKRYVWMGTHGHFSVTTAAMTVKPDRFLVSLGILLKGKNELLSIKMFCDEHKLTMRQREVLPRAAITVDIVGVNSFEEWSTRLRMLVRRIVGEVEITYVQPVHTDITRGTPVRVKPYILDSNPVDATYIGTGDLYTDIDGYQKLIHIIQLPKSVIEYVKAGDFKVIP